MNTHTHTYTHVPTICCTSPKSIQYRHIYCVLAVRLEMSITLCLQDIENRPKYGNY